MQLTNALAFVLPSSLAFGTGSRPWEQPGMAMRDIHVFEVEIFNEGAHEPSSDQRKGNNITSRELEPSSVKFSEDLTLKLETMSLNLHRALTAFLSSLGLNVTH